MSLKDKCQEVADKVHAKLCGTDKQAKLYHEIEDKDERIQKLEGEVAHWKEKFDLAWSAWHRLAIETKGAEEAAKMAEALKQGQ
jgi:predicted nuclease with TOPRIM domain